MLKWYTAGKAATTFFTGPITGDLSDQSLCDVCTYINTNKKTRLTIPTVIPAESVGTKRTRGTGISASSNSTDSGTGTETITDSGTSPKKKNKKNNNKSTNKKNTTPQYVPTTIPCTARAVMEMSQRIGTLRTITELPTYIPNILERNTDIGDCGVSFSTIHCPILDTVSENILILLNKPELSVLLLNRDICEPLDTQLLHKRYVMYMSNIVEYYLNMLNTSNIEVLGMVNQLIDLLVIIYVFKTNRGDTIDLATFAYIISDMIGINNDNKHEYVQELHNDAETVFELDDLKKIPKSNLVSLGHNGYEFIVVPNSPYKQTIYNMVGCNDRTIEGKYKNFGDDLTVTRITINHMECVTFSGNTIHGGGICIPYSDGKYPLYTARIFFKTVSPNDPRDIPIPNQFGIVQPDFEKYIKERDDLGFVTVGNIIGGRIITTTSTRTSPTSRSASTNTYPTSST